MQPRRPWLWLAAWLTPLAATTALAAEPTKGPPNVLFISVDDMNDWVGCLGGYPGIKTPNIQRLADRGLLFTNAHCASPLCCPSRTAIMTGLRPSTTGIYGNNQWWRPHLPDVVTLPMHFMAHGYQVLGAGKVFHHTIGFNPPGQWHEYFQQVFDDPWDRPAGNADPQAKNLSENRRGRVHFAVPREQNVPAPLSAEGFRIGSKPPAAPPGHPLNGILPFHHEFDWGTLAKDESQYGDALAVDWAGDYLRQPHEKPFFLAVGLFHPHLPWYAPAKYFDLYPRDSVRLPIVPDDDLDDVPAIGRQFAAVRRSDFEAVKQSNNWSAAVQAYLAAISFADAQVGRLLDALDAGPSAERTAIVFWSDHGWHLGEKQHWHKATLWEQATHVPLIIVAPGVTQPNTRSPRPVNLIDLYPTLSELCGLPAKNELDGQSLLPLLREPQAEWNRPSLITYLRGNHAVRDERWRYIRYADGGEEIYDRQADPNEWTNLAARPGMDTVKRDLALWLPKIDAAEAPNKNAYTFDPATYTWSLKQAKP